MSLERLCTVSILSFSTAKDKGKRPLNAGSSTKAKVVPQSEQFKSIETQPQRSLSAPTLDSSTVAPVARVKQLAKKKEDEQKKDEQEQRKKEEEERKKMEEQKRIEMKKREEQRRKEKEERKKKEKQEREKHKFEKRKKKCEMTIAELEGKIRSCRSVTLSDISNMF